MKTAIKSKAPKKKQDPKATPVYQMLLLLYRSNMKATGHSWRRLNAALSRVLAAAAEGGMVFAETDYTQIHRDMRGSYWMHGDNFYALAVKANNLSACKSYEAAVGCAGYELEGQRIYVGREFSWNGDHVTCTSIDKKNIVACSYKDRSSYPVKIARRYSITREDLQAEDRARAQRLEDEQMDKAKTKAKAVVSQTPGLSAFLLGSNARELAKENLSHGYLRDNVLSLIDKRFGKRGQPDVMDLLVMGYRYEREAGIVRSAVSTWVRQQQHASEIVKGKLSSC